MKFLAIDTSGRALSVVAVNGEKKVISHRGDCAMRHSVLLMDEIDAVLHEAGLAPADCDFFACVVGPGSFTGIRIGIATVKGLCLACGKDALALTSFDTLAYADRRAQALCLVDAGHGNYYACAYRGTEVAIPPAFLTRVEADPLITQGFSPVGHTALFDGVTQVDAAQGLCNAAIAKAGEVHGAHLLEAMYLRKSSAEELR